MHFIIYFLRLKVKMVVAVDGQWSLWSGWTECNVTCGGGSSGRSRFCSESLHGGSNCTGPAEQYLSCNEHECPSKLMLLINLTKTRN